MTFLVQDAGGGLAGLVRRCRAQVTDSPLGRRLAHGTVWLLGGTLVSRTLALVTSVVMARLLGRAGFGELGTIQITIGMFQTFAGFELGVTATKYVAEFKVRDPEKAGRIVGLSTFVAWITGAVVAVVMFVSASTVSTRTLAAPQLSGVLQISALALLMGAVSGAQSGVLYGLEAFRRVAWVNLATGLVSLPFTVIGGLIAGLTGAVWGLVLTQTANVLFGNIAVRLDLRRRGIVVRYWESRREWRVLFGFSLPAVLSGLLVSPVGWVCQAILINQPGGFDQMGWFTAANQWQMAILFLPGVLGGVVAPVFADLAGLEDRHRYRKLLWLNIAFNVAVCAAIALPVSLGSAFIMSGYGPSFTSGYPVLIVLCGGTIVYSALSVLVSALISRGLMWWYAGQQAVWAVVIIVMTWQLRDRGAMGLAIATFLAYAIQLISTAFLYNRVVGHSPPAAAVPAVADA